MTCGMTRPLRLTGALAVLLSLWLPWYEIRIPDALRHAFDAPNAQMPPGFADFGRGLLSAIPPAIGLNGWQAMQNGDVALALLGGAVALSVVLTVDVRAILAAAAAIAGVAIVHVLDQPGPNEYVAVKLGPWISLAGAAAIALSAWGEAASSTSTSSSSDAWAAAPSDAWAPGAPASVPPPSP
jgi:hypothetical protein